MVYPQFEWLTQQELPHSKFLPYLHFHLDLNKLEIMESHKRLEENLKELSKKMVTLKELKENVARKKAQEIAGWLENVKSNENQFEEFRKQINELNKGGATKLRITLNTKVIEILKWVNGQEEEVNVILSAPIETLFKNLSEGKPQKFTYTDLKKFTSGLSTKIDKNGNVYRGELPDKVQIVVKVLTDEDTVEKTFMAEMNTMFKTSHRNLVKLYGYCFEKNMQALVFEYMTKGSLDMYLYEERIDVDWEKLYDIAVDTAKGLSYLHDGCEKQIIHHDVKASNVLLDSNLSPKLTNFGVTKMMGRENTHVSLSRYKGDPSCQAPEMMQSLHLTSKCDVYSFGMMLLEVLGRRRNSRGRVYFPNVVWDMLKKREFEKIMKECGLKEENKEKAIILCMVAFWCIQYTDKSRPSMDIVVKMLERKIKVEMPPKWNSPSQAMNSVEDVVYDFN